MFDPKLMKLSATYAHQGILYGLAADLETNTLVVGGMDPSVYRLELDAKKPAFAKAWTHHRNYISSLVGNDGVVISGSYDRTLVWTDATSSKLLRRIEAHEGWVRAVAISPDGQWVVSVADDMLAKVWDAKTGELRHTLKGHPTKTPQGYATALYAVAVSPDGKLIATADRIGEVRVWQAETGKEIAKLHAPAFYTYDPAKRVRSIGGIRSVCFSPDGSELALSGIGQVTNVDGFVGPYRVEVWDVAEAKRVFVGEDKHKAVLNSVLFHPSEPWLIAAGGGDSGGILAFWDRKTTKATHAVKPKGHIQRLVLDATSHRLYAAGYEGVQVWEPRSDSNPPK